MTSQQMLLPVPLSGALSLPFRAFGLRASKISQYLRHLRADVHEVMRSRKITIDATFLFADT